MELFSSVFILGVCLLSSACAEFDPCRYITCPKGEICREHTIYCITTPCPPPFGVCEPIEKDQCSVVTCPPGEVCEVIQVECFTTPCPPIPTCVPAKKQCKYGEPMKSGSGRPILCNDEKNMTCPDPYKCQPSLSDKQKICCLKRDPCENVKCEEGETCELQEVQCIRAPCPPVPVCVKEKCKYGEPLEGDAKGKPFKCDKNKPNTCPDPYECQSNRKGDGGICCPKEDPCRNVTCAEGEYCELKDVICIRAPCPPIPTCVPNPCKYGEPLKVEYTGKPVICNSKKDIPCPDSYQCELSPSGHQICCPRNPCETVDCKEGETCELEEVTCVKAPCLPIPTCVPIKKPCQHGGPLTLEYSGQPVTCCNKTGDFCPSPYLCQLSPTHDQGICCPKKLECPLLKCFQNCEYYKYTKEGCRTCECIDPCSTKKCKKGRTCKVLNTITDDGGPGPAIPVCVYDENSCKHH